MLTLETLPHQIQTGDIDTVVVAFPDLQGRPVGKRVTGSFFLEHVLHHGIEVCDYLMACDVDMEPLPGYRFANWETGYGDLNAVIDPQTVRPLPWLPGSALVLCDLLTLEGEPVEVSPRRILRRQLERAAGRGLEVKCATELEFYLFLDSFAEAADKHWQRPRPPRRHHRGLPAAPDVARGVHHREDPQPDGGGRDPHRVLQGRGRHRPARDQHHLRRRPGGGRPSPGVQERGQGDRLGVRAGRHLHGQVVHGHGRLLVPHPHQPVGRRERLPPDGPGGRTRSPRRGTRASVPSSWPASSSPPTSWPGASPRT